MPKIYLLGGENVYKRDAKDVNQQAFNDASESPNVLVLSWARASFDKSYKRRKIIYDYFRFLGACSVNIIDYLTSKEEIEEKFAQANLIYLTGGVPSILIERLKKVGIDALLSKFTGVIIGRSAGALALCKKCVITCRSNKEVKVISGLGLVDITLKAHYKPENDEALEAFSFEDKIFAVPKGSALIYDKGVSSFFNTVFLFQNGQKQTLS
jgi:dipeptidase E